MDPHVEQVFIKVINQNDKEAFKRLLEQYSPDIKLQSGYTPLMLCIGEKKIDLVKVILDFKCNIDAINNNGTTALKIAVLKADDTLIKILLENDASPNLFDENGYTPLMYAVKNGNNHIVQLLMDHNADPYLKSFAGNNSALDFAKITKNKILISILEQTNKQINEIEIDDLIGQELAKKQLREIIALYKLNQERKNKSLPEIDITLHSIYIGNPGTGKTTFARFFAQEIKKIGILNKGHLVEVSRNDLVAQYVGQTAGKTKTVFESALDGILFIDEAYSLKNNKEDQFGQECINTLISLIENNRERIIVILAGYKDEMLDFLHHNSGLKSRIPNIIQFDDFSNGELQQIMKMMLEKLGLDTPFPNIEYAVKEISKKRKERSFGNAREIRNCVDRSVIQQSLRLSKKQTLHYELEELKSLIFSDFTPDPDDSGTYQDLFVSLNDKINPLEKIEHLVGLKEIKNEIKELANFVEISKLRTPDKLPEIGLHMVFTGNPGTGKTTVARLLGTLLKNLDFLSSGHVVEADRSTLVAPYVGQTAIKTKETIDRALGGILFIDEAYTLFRGTGGNDFGLEAIDTLLKFMEDYRSKFVVILAGYPKEMDIFLGANSGLKSRFNRFLTFPDFTLNELSDIAQLMAKEKSYTLSEKAINKIQLLFKDKINNLNFGNARDIRNMLEKSYKMHATRLIELKNQRTLNAEDLNRLEEEDFSD